MSDDEATRLLVDYAEDVIDGILTSAQDIAKGGLATALAERCLAALRAQWEAELLSDEAVRRAVKERDEREYGVGTVPSEQSRIWRSEGMCADLRAALNLES